jgi:hypothetical protein
LFQYEAYYDKKRIRQNLNDLKKSNSRSVSREVGRDAKDITRNKVKEDGYHFSFGVGKSENHKSNLSKDVSKDRLKSSYGEFGKNKSSSKLKQSNTDSQTSLIGSQNRNYLKSSHKAISHDKYIPSEKIVSYHPHSTTNKYFDNTRDITPQRLMEKTMKPKTEYSSYLTENTSQIYTLYKKKTEGEGHKITGGDFFDYSFSKKTFSNTQQDEGRNFTDIGKGSTSGTQSTYHLEDNKINSKKLESIEEKQFNIISIIQESKRSMRAVESNVGNGNTYDTVHRMDEVDL